MIRTRLAGGIALGGLALAVAIAAPGWRDHGQTGPRAATVAAGPEDLIAALAGAATGAGERLSGPWALDLPADLGGHAGARAETWIVALHLRDAAGLPVGATLTLSRLALAPGSEAASLALRDVHAAGLSLGGPGLAARREDRIGRGLGAAGADGGAVWQDDWRLCFGGAAGAPLDLAAATGDLRLRVRLDPAKPALALDPAGQGPARGLLLPRLTVTGTLGAGETTRPVTGTALLAHLWGDLPPGDAAGPVIRDRLVVQLDDGSDLSLERTRRRDGIGPALVEGLAIAPDGTATALAGLEMTEDGSGRWQLAGDGLTLGLALLVETGGGPGGGRTALVEARGLRDGRAVTGLGTLELGRAEAAT